MDLGLVGHERGEDAAEADRLGGEVDAPAVALVEDQVDDGEHRRQSFGEHLVARHGERDAGVLDLRLGAGEAALHRLGGDEEGGGDVLGAQPAEGAQRERDLGLGRERRMTAGEDELQALVADGHGLFDLVLDGLRRIEQPRLGGERALSPDAVDRAIAGGRDEPGDGVVGSAVARPALGGDGEGVLGGLLGEVEVAEEADQGGQHTAPLVAEDVVDQLRRPSRKGRTSTEPPRRTAGILPAIASATSRSSASSR
jgi:hypothetical protein